MFDKLNNMSQKSSETYLDQIEVSFMLLKINHIFAILSCTSACQIKPLNQFNTWA